MPRWRRSARPPAPARSATARFSSSRSTTSSASAPARSAQMRSNHTTEPPMKMPRSSGWKTRVQSLLLAALCGVAAITSLPTFAQDPAASAPAPVETAAAPAADTPPEAPAVATAEATTAPAAAVATDAAAPAAEPAAAEAPPAPTISKADTVWVLVSAALVIFMTLPGLALFYGGLVRSKNVLSILVQNLVVFSLVAVLWALYGYSFAFTEGN